MILVSPKNLTQTASKPRASGDDPNVNLPFCSTLW